MLFGSFSLARRIEAAQSQNQYDYAEAHARLGLSSPCAAARMSETATALYAGENSPLTQSFGVGMESQDEPPEQRVKSQLDALEEFFFTRGAAVHLGIANLAAKAYTQELGARGYVVSEYSHVLGLDLRNFESKETVSSARAVEEEELDSVAETIAAGFLEHNVGEAPIAPDFLEIFSVSMRSNGSRAFAVEIGGALAGAGGITILDDVAMLAGASVQPRLRNQGAQKALINERLRYAKERGCDVAVVTTTPGSISQANMQKIGFSLLYARVKFSQLTFSPRL